MDAADDVANFLPEVSRGPSRDDIFHVFGHHVEVVTLFHKRQLDLWNPSFMNEVHDRILQPSCVAVFGKPNTAFKAKL